MIYIQGSYRVVRSVPLKATGGFRFHQLGLPTWEHLVQWEQLQRKFELC